MEHLRLVFRIAERVIWVAAGIIVIAVAFYELRRGQDLGIILVTLAVGVAFLVYATMTILKERGER